MARLRQRPGRRIGNQWPVVIVEEPASLRDRPRARGLACTKAGDCPSQGWWVRSIRTGSTNSPRPSRGRKRGIGFICRSHWGQNPTPQPLGRGSAWQSASFGTKRSRVQIAPPQPLAESLRWASTRPCRSRPDGSSPSFGPASVAKRYSIGFLIRRDVRSNRTGSTIPRRCSSAIERGPHKAVRVGLNPTTAPIGRAHNGFAAASNTATTGFDSLAPCQLTQKRDRRGCGEVAETD